MQAEIICIGDELLIGQTINTNSGWLGEQLNTIGIRVARNLVIGDDRDEIMNALREAEARSELIIITGGLGPTKDDITKKTIAKYFGAGMTIHQPTLERVTAFFKSRNVPLLKVNEDQALVPDNCEVIENTRGTAPGMWFEKNGAVFISLPGVPYEMKGIMEDILTNKIKTKFKQPDILHKTVLTIGIGESMLADKISDWEDSLAEHDIKLAYLPSPGMVKLRLSAYNPASTAATESLMNSKIEELQQLAGAYIFGYGKETLEEIIGKLLIENNMTVATAESCTGGTIAQMLTSVPGSSNYFRGGIVAYHEEIKTSMLNVNTKTLEKHGVVSSQVAEEMAVGAKNALNTTWALATTGIAGPAGGTESTPVGLIWIAVAGPLGVISARFNFGNNRERNIRMASNSALNLLRKEILGQIAC